MAIDTTGNLYIADPWNHRIRRVDASGIITTIAGTGTAGFSGDGGLATLAQLNDPVSVAVDGVGNVYITDKKNVRIRRISPDGRIQTIAGNGESGYAGDGGPAVAAMFSDPWGVEVDTQGNVYIADSANHRIRRIDRSGMITTIVGSGNAGRGGDGWLAVQAELLFPMDIALDATGNIYIAQNPAHTIRKVDPSGYISLLAGTGVRGFSGDGDSTLKARLAYALAVAVTPQGQLVIADTGNNRLRQVFGGRSMDGNDSVSADGSKAFRFDVHGRHFSTLRTDTGTEQYRFGYDTAGYLTSITDTFNNVTRIERNGATPTAIIAPDGQRTTLTVDTDGYLSAIRNPAGETHAISYNTGGLLQTFTDPRGNVTRMTYDSVGRLIGNDNAVGGGWRLARTDNATGYDVSMTSALGRKTAYRIENPTNGDQRRTTFHPDGTQTRTLIGANGTETVTDPDGTVQQTTYGPDPRFGMQAPLVAEFRVTLPSGLSSKSTTTRTVTLADNKNLLSLTRETTTTSINGRAYQRIYDAASRTLTSLTPSLRQVTTTLDTNDRVASIQQPGIAPWGYSYDSRGRLIAQTQGTGTTLRTSRLSYNTQGLPATVTDALGRVTQYSYDLAGRVTQQTLPGGRLIGYSYDANGNLTSLTPPGRPAHRFSYTALDQTSAYTPPAVSNGGETLYEYNADKQLTKITRPDGQAIGYRYYASGELGAMDTPAGTTQYGYTLAGGTGGHLNRIITPDGIDLRYSYDGSLPLNETWSGPISGTVSRSWNNDFQLSRLSLNGAGIDYQYDADGLVTQAGSLALSYDQTAPQLLGATQGKVTTGFIYNAFNELAQQTTYVDGAVHYDVSYTRDALGRITGKTETIGGQTDSYGYRYDSAGRLTQVSKNGTVTGEYSYDANGNRVSAIGQTATHDDQDRLTNNSGAQYEYNANGELKRITAAGQVTDYQYDVLGNLRHVTLPDGTTIDYLIDGNHRRIGKKVNGTLVQGLLYQDQLKPIAELDGSGNTIARFVYATKTNVPEYMVKGGETYRIVTDHLGSPRLVINTTTGAIAQRIDYDEYGFVILDTNPGFQPFGYAGGLIDQHTKLVRFGARDYDPKVGRWTAKDPIRFEGGDTNLYGYVANDPVNFVDPLGLYCLSDRAIGGISGMVGGGVSGAIAGAMAGFAAGGPLGAAIGGVGGTVVGAVAGGFFGLATANSAGGAAFVGGLGAGAGGATVMGIAGGAFGSGVTYSATSNGAPPVVAGVVGGVAGGYLAGGPTGAAVGGVGGLAGGLTQQYATGGNCRCK